MLDVSAMLGGFFAGGCGGLVRTFALKSPQQSWKDGVVNVLTGGICAHFTTPITISIVDAVFRLDDVDPDAKLRLAQFITGVLGVVLVGMIIDVAQAYTRKKTGMLRGNDDEQE